MFLMVSIGMLLFISFGVYIRLRPLWTNPTLGVDHWYWLLCAEDVRKRRSLPPKLPYFMLEIEEQWYPPLFAGLLAFLPMRWLRNHGGILSQMIDLLHGLMIFFAVFWFSHSLIIAFLSGLSYLIAWFPMSYNTQLQPRGLANLLLTLLVMLLWFYIDTGSRIIWGGVLILSVLLLFIHKMTVQMWVVYLLGLGLWTWDWRIPALLPASVLLAIIVSKGFYIKMLKAHWDIVSFWHKNIKDLGSHQYYESPLYQKAGFSSTAFHQRGLRYAMGRLLTLFRYNVFILFLPLLICYALYHSQGRLESYLWGWLGFTYLWALLTTFLPHLKALGAGEYYLYQSFYPLFLLSAVVVPKLSVPSQWLFLTLWGLALFLSGSLWEKRVGSIFIHSRNQAQKDLQSVLNYLKELPKDGVFCIPFTLPDITAYWTRKRVFWGGHSYGFNALLKPYFPVMRERVLETLINKPLNYVLFWTRYLDSLEDIGLRVGRDLKFLFAKGEYELYEILK